MRSFAWHQCTTRGVLTEVPDATLVLSGLFALQNAVLKFQDTVVVLLEEASSCAPLRGHLHGSLTEAKHLCREPWLVSGPPTTDLPDACGVRTSVRL